jgi:RimJ/RimL family protein N-acetyltransferase
MTSVGNGQRPAAEKRPAAADQGSKPAGSVTERPGPQPVLTDGLVRLRALNGTDVDAVVAACSDPDTQRWTSVPSPYLREHAEYFVHEFAPQQWQTGIGLVWAICGPDDRYAGNMDLRISRSDPGRGNVGFHCAPWARGQGWTTIALELATGWGFEKLGLARIEWRAFVGNEASRRVAEKAGFTFEGTQRGRLLHRGERMDGWVASLLPGDRRTPLDR